MHRSIPFALALLAVSTSLPVQSQTPRQERIKGCYQQSKELQVEKSKWKAFMKACVDGKKPEAKAPDKASSQPGQKDKETSTV